MIAKHYNKGLDVGRFVFALLIPFLHIPFADDPAIEIIRQYLARLGVPYFFAVSGYLLSLSIGTRGPGKALKRYSKRIGIMLFIWVMIYFPLYMGSADFSAMPIRVLLFKTPGYLWYLSAMLFASVPFCLFRNVGAKYLIAFVLYILGTLGNGSYSWLIPECTWYTDFFLTTRNGLFFAFPLMCVGEYVGASEKFCFWKNSDWMLLILTMAALWVEIFICRSRVEASADCSMYFVLPLTTMMLMKFFATHFSNELKSGHSELLKIPLQKWSSTIYLLQYGIITVGGLLQRIKIVGIIQNVAIYVGIIIGAWIVLTILRGEKILNTLYKTEEKV